MKSRGLARINCHMDIKRKKEVSVVIEIKDKKIIIDGKPHIIMSGEIHYFRLKRQEWEDRIYKLKMTGCNAVASYVPWLCHEPIEGQVDLTGKTRPELDLDGFISLCEENGLYVILRPGPFIMAEMKNEGIPYWVYEKHPEIVPVSWDGEKVPTRTIDYLAPGFLQEVYKWYSAVMPIIASHLYTRGGKVIGIQLDNEIGMLSWVSNCPDLTDNVIGDFIAWLENEYDAKELQNRYPFNVDDMSECRKAIRSPKEKYALQLLHDLGYYMRERFARYVATLRSYAEEFGVRDVPFFINIHGTAGKRGFTYPIGISQLYKAYTQEAGYISGSDVYLGDLSMNNFQDLYIINAFTDAVNNQDQPLTSLEFECGDGNYGLTYSGRYDPSAVDLKTRMCIAQGNRMLNYYLFAGGINYVLDPKASDGNGRIAFTGERHGFAAPISPEGQLNYTYFSLARVVKSVNAVSSKLAVMKEEHDRVALAFIPDYYMTESYYPKSSKMVNFVRNLEQNRGSYAWEIMVRAMLLANYRFGAVDIQNKPLDPHAVPVLVVPSARYMDDDIQRKLVEYLNDGGNILLYGEVPLYDMEGNACTILADALGVEPMDTRYSSPSYYLSVYADGWAAPRPEVRVQFAQALKTTNCDVILRIRGTDEVCGFDVKVGSGRAIVVATAYICDICLFKSILGKLGASPALYHDNPYHGIFMTSTATEEGERFIHIINLDGFEKELHIYEEGHPLLGGEKIVLQGRQGIMLPINVSFGDIRIDYSTAEIMAVGEHEMEFCLTQPRDVICFSTKREILPCNDYTVERQGDKCIVKSLKHAKIDTRLIVRFKD